MLNMLCLTLMMMILVWATDGLIRQTPWIPYYCYTNFTMLVKWKGIHRLSVLSNVILFLKEPRTDKEEQTVMSFCRQLRCMISRLKRLSRSRQEGGLDR